MNGEGCSVSTISRFLKFSKTTICRWIEKLGSEYHCNPVENAGQEYQADELRTYIVNKKNECWMMYAINKAKRNIVEWCVGRRTKENLEHIISKVLTHNPETICTDRLQIYQTLVPAEIHIVKKRKTNHIERMNLQFRNQLKRLSRKTICFSKSEKMLRASVGLCLKYMQRRNANGIYPTFN